MLITNQHPHNRSLMSSVIGVPNAGKSTLINKILGMDLSVVTHLPQTTRNHFQCVATVDRTELVFVDTPGLHRSGKEINKRMNEQVLDGARGVDLNLILIDLSRDVADQLKQIKELFDGELKRVWVVFTKVDLIDRGGEFPASFVTTKINDFFNIEVEKHFVTSTKEDKGVKELIDALVETAPNAPHYYEDGSMSNKNERFFVSEYIREQAFLKLKEELPYEIAVMVEEYKDLRDRETKSKLSSKISAAILVNRPSQRAIVVGKGGSVIKEIGSKARERIEEMVGGKVMLNLHVKVAPRWFKNNMILEELGLPRAKTSARVWRAEV